MESLQDSGRSNPDTHPATAEHPRTLGWVATTALAMGGSNQSLFLITALFAGQGEIPGQGSAAVPLLIVGLLLALGRGAGLDRAGSHVSEAGRRHCRNLRGSVSPLQPGIGQPHRRLLLVGLGSDLRLDCDFLRCRDPRMVSAQCACASPRVRAGVVLRAGQSMRCEVGRQAGDSDRDRVGGARVHFSAGSDRGRAGGLAAGDDVPSDGAVRGLVRRAHRRHGGSLSDRLCRARVRGCRVPRRRNRRSQQERAARHVRERRHGVGVFHRAAGRVARRAGSRATRQGSHAGAGTDVCAGVRQLRQGGRDLVHDVQHVPRHAAAACRRRAHDVAARRGRPAAAHAGEAGRAPTCPGWPPA